MTAFVLVREPEASEESHAAHGFLGVPTIVWQAANLVLFLVLLVVLLKKPLSKFFADRRRQVEEEHKKAEADRLRAEELAQEIDARLSGIEVEIANLKSHAATESQKEEKELVAQAEAEAQRIVARGSAEIDARVREARKELTAYAADLSVEMADEILKKSLTPEDHARLVDEGADALGKLAVVPSGKRS
jgi:F-type H+-transporting ATPase subunit b